jgi:hypothetical protein
VQGRLSTKHADNLQTLFRGGVTELRGQFRFHSFQVLRAGWHDSLAASARTWAERVQLSVEDYERTQSDPTAGVQRKPRRS